MSDRRRLSELPHVLRDWDRLVAPRLDQRAFVLFLDYDGTLAPIVDDPEAVAIPPPTIDVLERLAASRPLALISGRDLADLRGRVALPGAWYAGSHGFDIVGPAGERHQPDAVTTVLPVLDEAEADLRSLLAGIPGAAVERKRFTIAAHYRKCPDRAGKVTAAVDSIARQRGLRTTTGRRVVELRPDVDWGKGHAVRWLLRRLDAPDALAIYAGDDVTDEDALAVVAEHGLGIVVRSAELGDRLTAAHVAVDGPEELRVVLDRLAQLVAANAR